MPWVVISGFTVREINRAAGQSADSTAYFDSHPFLVRWPLRQEIRIDLKPFRPRVTAYPEITSCARDDASSSARSA
jgi:hypothetical protein